MSKPMSFQIIYCATSWGCRRRKGKERERKKGNKGKRKKKERRWYTKGEKIDRKINQHDKRSTIMIKGKQGLQRRKLKRCEIEGSEGNIFQFCSRAPKLMTHCAPWVWDLLDTPLIYILLTSN